VLVHPVCEQRDFAFSALAPHAANCAKITKAVVLEKCIRVAFNTTKLFINNLNMLYTRGF
jgi:hypothetical protein